MSKSNHTGSKLAAGVGLTVAAAVAAAGYHFLYSSPESKKNRAIVKSWGLKMKGEILERMEDMKEINEEKYESVVDAVTKKYEAVKSIDKKELKDAAKELKAHWKNIKKEIEAGAKKVTKTAKSVSKKTKQEIKK